MTRDAILKQTGEKLYLVGLYRLCSSFKEIFCKQSLMPCLVRNFRVKCDILFPYGYSALNGFDLGSARSLLYRVSTSLVTVFWQQINISKLRRWFGHVRLGNNDDIMLPLLWMCFESLPSSLGLGLINGVEYMKRTLKLIYANWISMIVVGV